ncbi:Rhamnulokinase [Collinsella intestinalis]|nr:Rhamnulokinase [Collinsella intestinalis]
MLEKLRLLARESGYEGSLGVADFFRAVYESLALRYLHVIELIENVTGDPCERIRLIGGGSQNAALCQLVADVCGRTVVAGPHEASAIGNLLVQMTAQGAFETLKEARVAVAPSWCPTVYVPREERAQSGGRGVPC